MESIETLNTRLEEFFGQDSNTNQPIFRIVWANDEVEKILTMVSQEGLEFLSPQTREVKKYPYLKDLYVLERLVVVPDQNSKELLGKKLSYEPLWAYCNDKRQPVRPVWPATKLVIDVLYAALGKQSLRKYIEDEKETSKEGRDQRIKELQDTLFADDTDVSDALHYKEGIVVPNSYNKEQS